MTFNADSFRQAYVQQGGSENGAKSYVSYLNRVDRICGGIEERLAQGTVSNLAAWIDRQPHEPFQSARNLRNSRSALKKYLDLRGKVAPRAASKDEGGSDSAVAPPRVHGTGAKSHAPGAINLGELLAEARALAARYYSAFARPLGATGEIAELTAAELLGIELTPARTPGFDGLIKRSENLYRVQIKGRAVASDRRYRGRCPSIKCSGYDLAMLVLLDRRNMSPLEIWEAKACEVARKLAIPGSRARNDRNSLAISQFISGHGSPPGDAPQRIWPASA